jgi:hypothetical protein
VELACALDRTIAEDAAFGNDIHALRNQSGNMPITAEGDVFHGRADKVVQLRDVHGDQAIN